MRLTEFKVLSFDCYGTLIDWESGIHQALLPELERHGLSLSRDRILESFARHEAAQEAETPGMIYSELLARVHRRLTAEWGIAAEEEEHRAFAAANGDRRSFAATSRRLGVAFDAVYTAEEIGSYKPDLRNFRYLLAALERQGYGRDDILHVAQSLYHDHAPANALGLHSAWIDRRQGAAGWGATMPPPSQVRWDFRFASLAELVAADRRERGG